MRARPRSPLHLVGLLSAALGLGCHPPSAPQEPVAQVAVAAPVQTVAMRIDTPIVGTVLLKNAPGAAVVCEAPCLREVSIEKGAFYELHAPEHLPTAPFELYSPEDSEVWLVHEPTRPGTVWALRAATIASAAVGGAMFVTANVLGANASHGDDAPFVLGVSGLVVGLGVTGLFGGLTAAYADSDHELRDPSLPGFRW